VRDSRYFITRLILTATVIGALVLSLGASAQTPDELRQSINERASSLEEINKQIKETQTKLDQTEVEKRSLNKELQTIEYNIKQLNLGIQSSEIQIDKLGLELQSIAYDIKDIETSVKSKREAIIELLRELWQKEREGLLVILLKNQSLAESILESEGIKDLNQGLSVEVRNLIALNQELDYKYNETGTKKSGVELENKNLKNRKFIVAEEKGDREDLLARTKNQEKSYQTEISELEKKQEAIGQEIAELEQALRLAFDPSLLPLKRPGVLGPPVADVFLTQKYGRTAFAERAYRSKEHNGLDFRAPVGTPIFATEDGTVKAVGDNGRLQYGRYILIEHNNNLTTLYAHLSRQIVGRGDIVSRGQVIGYSGNTGYVTGPHLHLGLYWTPSIELKNFPGAGNVPIGVTIDPEDYL
jgi:murein DD-endopeptidase MepM/ murein hydrolase activator NlpD